MAQPVQVSPRHTVQHRFTARDLWVPPVAALLIVVAFQLVGPWKISMGVAAVTVFPMVWGLLAGVIIAAQRRLPFTPRMWKVADQLMAVSVAMLVAMLAFTIGPYLRPLFNAGPALLLQEFGHLFGTVMIALPIAVLLRMGRATVGATFAIDREASFAIVGDKYGTQSEEYRGVLSMYVFGTMFGAVLVALIASLVSSLKWFDPLALAMGSGVGSTSMMSAGAAAIGNAHPEVAEQIKAMAATSNLITMIVGTYVGVWIALPLADRMYRLLTRRSGARTAQPRPRTDVTADPSTAPSTAPSAEPSPMDPAPAPAEVRVPLWLSLAIASVLGFVSATIAAGRFDPQILVGFVLIIASTSAAIGLAKLVRGKIQMIIWASVIGTVLSSPWSPVQDFVVKAAGSIDFLSMCCVVLTFAGLAMAQNLPALRRIGWRIIPVGVVAVCASFLLATVIAEFALGFWS